jgi:hypothetical protein
MLWELKKASVETSSLTLAFLMEAYLRNLRDDGNDRIQTTAMIQPLEKSVSFDEFIAWKPENGRYELRRGAIASSQLRFHTSR